MKQRILYFNFYPSDFIKGVRGLTAQEVGVYTMLLCRIYEENGPVDFHEGRLAAYCGCTEKTIAKVVERLVYLGRLRLVGKQLTDDRAEAEILKRENALKSQSRAGEASAQKRKQNQQAEATDVQRPFNHTDTDTDTDKKEEKREAIASPKNRGSRLPLDWSLPDDWAVWASGQGMDLVTIQREADRFADYWRGLSGAKATKVDWQGTWRNWVRKWCDDRKPKSRSPSYPTAEDLTAMMMEGLKERRT